jgi:hypothetical protein
MAKKAREPSKSKYNLPIRFNKDELDDLAELKRQQEAAGVPKLSTFAKQLLNKQLYPDPSSERAIRELLRELLNATKKLQAEIEKLDARTKKMRNGFANGFAALLTATAGWSDDEVREWVDQHMRG